MIERAISGQDVLVWVLAFLVGVLYALVIHWVESRRLVEGYTWLQVVVGVLLTLVFAPTLVGLWATLMVLSLFACTGIPMIAVTLYRIERARRAAREAMRAEARLELEAER